MFPFKNITREYRFTNEQIVFDLLNELTYNTFPKTLHGNFVQHDPPTFELWFRGDVQHSGKPFSTKLIVRLDRAHAGTHVKATAFTNKLFYIAIIGLITWITTLLFKDFNLLSFAGFIIGILLLGAWDRLGKK